MLLVLCLLFSCRWPVEEISDCSGLELTPIARDLLIVQSYIFFLFLPLVLYLVLIDHVLHLLDDSFLFAIFAGIGGKLLRRDLLEIAFVNFSSRPQYLQSGLIYINVRVLSISIALSDL